MNTFKEVVLPIFWIVLGMFAFVALIVFLADYTPEDYFSSRDLGNQGTYVCHVKQDWLAKNFSKECYKWSDIQNAK